jgi:outer membrane protein assembly factor BamB
VSQLRQLEDRFGGIAIPQLAASCADLGAMFGESETVSDWIRGIRADHPDFAPTESPKHMSMADALFSDEILWSIEPLIARGDPPRVVDFGGAPLLQTRNEIVVHSPGDTITSYRVDDGTILWKTALRLPGSFDDRIIIQWRPEERGTRRAVVDGQTMVFNGRDGLFAIGRHTGRRLWCRAHEPKDGPIAPPEADTAMAAEGGLLAAMPHAGRLALMKMSDGSMVWERDLLGESVAYVWMADDHVISANARLQRVHVFAKSDGRLLARILFDQPDPHNRLIELIRTENTICGPYANSNEKGIATIDLTTGETIWRTPVDKPLMQMFRPQEGYLGLGLLGGDVRIVDALTGRVVLERRVKGAQSIARGILIDGTLLVQPNATKGGVRARSLIALDIATDTELWRREDVVPLWRMDRPLQVIDGYLPVLVQSGRRNARRERSINLAMLDIRTGLGNDTKITLPSTRGPAQLNGDFEWMQQAGVAVIGTDTGVRVLRTVSNQKSEEEGL